MALFRGYRTADGSSRPITTARRGYQLANQMALFRGYRTLPCELWMDLHAREHVILLSFFFLLFLANAITLFSSPWTRI
ncbi:hypothetical protein M433DRAFT_161336, partial [Acidomyces richmondensis BFW]